jgi:hypothetical protein
MARRTSESEYILIETEKQEFKRMLNAVMVIYYKPNLTNDALRVWWHKLERFDFATIAKAFDTFTDNVQNIPTPPVPSDIVNLCRHKVTIHARLPSPLALESNKQHADEVIAYVAKNIKPKRDFRAWARKILSSPKNYPDISVRYANEAIGNYDE